jgi:hypothetical protein
MHRENSRNRDNALDGYARAEGDHFASVLAGRFPTAHPPAAAPLIDLSASHLIVLARPRGDGALPRGFLLAAGELFGTCVVEPAAAATPHVVLITSGVRPGTATEPDLIALARVHKVVLLAAGCCQSPSAMRDGYLSALPLLRHLPLLAGSQPVAHLGELLGYRAVASMADDERRRHASRLGPLLELRLPRRDALLRSMAAFVAVSSSPTRAAFHLGLHVRTVRRHRSMIEGLTGLSFGDPDEALLLGLAYRAARLSGARCGTTA